MGGIANVTCFLSEPIYGHPALNSILLSVALYGEGEAARERGLSKRSNVDTTREEN
jgi:hypothetical protein